MGPQANVLHSAVRISSWLVWILGSCLCLSSTQQFSPLPVLAITCDKPGSADAWITIREIGHRLMQCKRIRWRVCSAKNKETRTKVRCRECNIVVCYHMLLDISYKTAFVRSNWHWNWKAEHTNVSKYNCCNYWTDIFSSVFLMK